MYLALDGGDARVGECSVSNVELADAADLDGDGCGDITASALIDNAELGEITVPCLDRNGDGLLDINSCVTWDNNAGGNCQDPLDAIASTKSKCRCDVITVSNVPVPTDLCTGKDCSDGASCNGLETCDPGTGQCQSGTPIGCADDGNLCTTETCEPGTAGSDPSSGCLIAAGNAGTTCREAAGICDVTETCDGMDPNCPADEVAEVGVQCRDSAGICDVAETCDGTGVDCPADDLVQPGTECRASAGVCDVAETCTGDDADCPTDQVADAGTTCRGSAGVCDVAEQCDGTNVQCPGNIFQTGTPCRASAGICDVAETCTGGSAECPADGFLAAGTECRAAEGECDVAENCSGAGADCPADEKSTDVCRAANGACDVAESCDGIGNDCPSDELAQEGTACTDGDAFACTRDQCDGSGACVGEPDDTACADGELCTDEACDPANPDANSEGCTYAFDSTNDDETETPNACDTETCRTAGFWSTHGGITRAVLEQAPAACSEVCGEVLLAPAVTTAGNADSALEAMCVPVKGDARLQLVRQLTAASLNCLISRGTADCENASVEAVYQACDAACAAGAVTATVEGASIDCVTAIDCFNNGGDYRPGSTPSCMLGTCGGIPESNGGIPCDGPTACVDPNTLETTACVPFPGNCHDQAEPNDELGVSVSLAGPADSPKVCNDASKSKCTTIPPGETAGSNKGCGAGTRAGDEACPLPEVE